MLIKHGRSLANVNGFVDHGNCLLLITFLVKVYVDVICFHFNLSDFNGVFTLLIFLESLFIPLSLKTVSDSADL